MAGAIGAIGAVGVMVKYEIGAMVHLDDLYCVAVHTQFNRINCTINEDGHYKVMMVVVTQ